MSELRSVADALAAESLSEMPDARVEEDFVELHRAVERLERERLGRLAEIDRRRMYERDGHLSAASWLVNTFKLSWGAAREDLRMARALDEMPHTSKGLEEGDVSLSAARVLVQARAADPEAVRDAERELVHAARLHDVNDLQRMAVYWRQAVEHDHAGDADEAIRARRRLHASVSFMGMVRIDGDLDPESGEAVLTALRAVMDSEARRRTDVDHRTPAQRRADALSQVCRQWLDRSDRPHIAGERPHVTITVDADDLTIRGGSGGSAELDHAGGVPAQIARRIVCDASVMRVVMAGRSEPIDVGRRTPVVSPAIRRAVVLRDRSCRFRGATGRTRGAMRITSSTGPTAARRRCRTFCCCAADITVRFTDHTGSGWSWWMADRPSEDRTALCCRTIGSRIGLRRSGATRSRPPSAARSGGSARPRTPWGARA
jgi:hypothetical protein